MRQEHRYTPRGSTWKSCPACGQEPKSYYPIGKICHDCNHLLEWARHEHQRYAGLHDVELRTIPGGPNKINMPYYPGQSYTAGAEEYKIAEDAFSRGLMAILKMLSLATGGAAEIYRDIALGARNFSRTTIPVSAEAGYKNEDQVLVPRELAEDFDKLPTQLAVMIRTTFEAGIEHGQGLLHQLAYGGITVDSLTQQDAERARNIQHAVERADVVMLNAKNRHRKTT